MDDVLAALPEHVRDTTAPPPTIDELQAILDADSKAPEDGGVAEGLPSAEDLDAAAAEAQLVEVPVAPGDLPAETAAPQPTEAEASTASPVV